MDVCKVGIIGAGYMAREHAKAFADVPGVQLAGIYSRTRKRAEQVSAEYGMAGVYDSVEELYESTKAALVVVAVGELSMNAVARACCEFPWTILLEKPAGYNVADAEQIAAAARSMSRRVFVALNRRFYSSTRVVCDLLQTCGDSRFIHVQDQEDAVRALQAGRPKLVVDNWMYANSVHVVDYLRIFGRGNVLKVNPIIPWDSRDPRVVVATVKFDSGDIGLYEGIWNAPGPWSAAVATKAARYELRPLEQGTVQHFGERKAQNLLLHDWDQQFKPGLRLQAENAVAAALGKPSASVPIDDAFQTLCLVRDIYGLS
jgi:predicted dehydrogenase